MKYTARIIQHETELRAFLYRLEKLYRSNKLKLGDVNAILFRHCHKDVYGMVGELWPTFFPEIAWAGELGTVAECTVLHCPGCDTFLGIDSFKYQSNAKMRRSRLCCVCHNKWRRDKAKGKLPWHIRKEKANKKASESEQ